MRITKTFGYHLISIFLSARHFATPFRQKVMSDEELHDIVSLLHTLYLVLALIQISTNKINILDLLVLESCLNGISLALIGPIYFFLDHRCPINPMRYYNYYPLNHTKDTVHKHSLPCAKQWLRHPNHQPPS